MKTKKIRKPSTAAMSNANWSIDTKAVHAGERNRLKESPVFPIWQTATYAFRDYAEIEDFLQGQSERFKYGRYGNPTQKALESKLAALEGAEDALVFASGMNAVTTAILALVKPGEHAIFSDSCYHNNTRFFAEILPAFGIRTTCVSPSDSQALSAALTPKTKVVFYEMPTNILLRMADLSRVAEACKSQPGVVLMIDSTFATPINLQPIRYGAQIVIQSLTKYIGGHDDLLGGCVCGSRKLLSTICEYRNIFGGIPDPHNSFLLLRSLKTFPLRMARLNKNGMAMARFLERHNKVDQIFYPGLISHPDNKVARKYLKGFGSVIYFKLKGGEPATKRFIENLSLPYIASNFGGVHTLAEPVSLLTYGRLTEERRAALGIGENMIRLCVGIESLKDIEADIQSALKPA
jgi:cystathionine gamma-synthase